MVDETIAAARVAAGAAHLDGLDPGWRDLLNPGLLDMASGRFQPPHPDGEDWKEPIWPAACGCVSAQWAYVQAGHPDGPGFYETGLALLLDRLPRDDGSDQWWAVEHGLLAEAQFHGHDQDTDDVTAEYGLLTRLWRQAIEGVTVGG